jgi:hypothetical protein
VEVGLVRGIVAAGVTSFGLRLYFVILNTVMEKHFVPANEINPERKFRRPQSRWTERTGNNGNKTRRRVQSNSMYRCALEACGVWAD